MLWPTTDACHRIGIRTGVYSWLYAGEDVRQPGLAKSVALVQPPVSGNVRSVDEVLCGVSGFGEELPKRVIKCQ
jgi:hypothetical protein